MLKVLWLNIVFIIFACNVVYGDCFSDYGHGYCTDYIKSPPEVGGRGYSDAPSGDAKTWPGNVSLDDIQRGDVAIFYDKNWGHVAYTLSRYIAMLLVFQFQLI